MFRILDMLFPPRVDELVLREVSQDDFLALVRAQLVSATRPGTVALLPFSHSAVRATIHEAKYHGNTHAFTLLALALADYLHDADSMPHTTIVIPIPLGKTRSQERGFNQTEEIARRALQHFAKSDLPPFTLDTHLLARTRDTPSQVSLPRHAREENMRGAFSTTCPADPTATYIIIDDVLTTGATLQSAIDALRIAGAEHIIPLALAH